MVISSLNFFIGFMFFSRLHFFSTIKNQYNMTQAINIRVRTLIAETRARLDELEMLCDTDQVISCGEAAAYLGVANATISRYIQAGRLHKIKRGARTGISMSEVEKLKKK